MRIDVVAQDQVGLPAFGREFLGQGLAEEFAQHGHAQLFRRCRSARRRLDAEARYA